MKIARRAIRPVLHGRMRTTLLIGAVVLLLTGLIAAAGLFAGAQAWLSGLLYAPAPTQDRIAIVAIDDQSLGAYGRSISAWPRTLHAGLVKRLSDAGARVIVFDALFDQPTDQDRDFADAIRAARESATGTRVVLALSGAQGKQISSSADAPLRYENVLAPVPALRDAGVAVGHVNVLAEADGYVRRLPLFLYTDAASPVLALSAVAYLSFLRIPPASFGQVIKAAPETVSLTAQRVVPVDAAGRMLTNFFGGPGTFPTYSYRAVNEGEIAASQFKDRIVLVGAVNATGITDRYLVPILRGTLLSGVEIHANALETLLQNRALTPQPLLQVWLSIALVAFIGALCLIPLRLRTAIPIYLISFIVLFFVASVVFTFGRMVMAWGYPAIALTFVFVGKLFSDTQLEIKRRTRIQSILESLARLSEKRMLLDEVLPRLSAEVLRLMLCGGAAIWLWDEATAAPQRVYGSLHLKGRGPLPRGDTEASSGWSTYEFAAYNAVMDHGLTLEKDAALIPLYHQAQPVGVIGAARGSAGKFSAEQLDFFKIFAENAAPILANACSYTAQVQSRELVESILSESPDPILVLDRHAQVTRTNDAAREALPDAVRTGHTLVSLLSASGLKAETLAKIETEFQFSQPFEQEIALGDHYFKLLFAPLRLNEGAWIVVLNDISALKELDALKTQMIRMASHDLKNPLGIIMGYTDLLLSGRIKEPPERFLRMIDDNAKRMNAIITDLLNIERLRAGRLDLAPGDIGDLLRETYREYEPQAAEKQQTYTLERPHEPTSSQFDQRQLKEALANLIGNAIKYTPEGGTVSVCMEANARQVRFQIRDSGYGISKEAQAGLFRPFYRVKTRQTANIPGTGLGLSLVKAVIEAHGGIISVESEEGKGSTFKVELPIRHE